MLGKAIYDILENWISGRCITAQNLLMELGTPRDQCGDDRGSHAASDVAHEIDDAGNRVVFLRRNTDVRGQCDGHEKEPEADHLGDAQPESGTEADRQVKP